MHARAEELIRTLDLAPHPEGGYFRRIFESNKRTEVNGIERPTLTAIKFLITEGVVSRWHRVDATEIWDWSEGSALELSMFDPETRTLSRAQLALPALSGRASNCSNTTAKPHSTCAKRAGASPDGTRVARLRSHCRALPGARMGVHRMRKAWTMLLLAIATATTAGAHAQDPASQAAPLSPAPPAASATAAPVRELEAITVSGMQPGPGLWKVRHGEHILYILGTQSPLPARMTWRSDEVEQVLHLAERVLGSPGVQVDADVGFFRGLVLLPSALKAAKNPDDQRLQDVLPADTYARWSRVKQRYLGRDAGIEKKRPLIAVFQLYQEALERSGMKERDVIEPVLEKALKKRKLSRTPTTLKLKIEDPKQAIADFRKEPLKPADLDCFNRTLDRIEFELPQIAARANAWAVGDVAALRNQSAEAQQIACLSAWFDTDLARKRGLTDLDARVRNAWLTQADAALRETRISFATVGINDLLKPGGYLALLQARGYTVEAPE